MQTVSTLFERELRKALQERLLTLGDQLSYGHAENYEHYKRMTGEIAGIRWVLDDAVPATDKIIQERG